MKKPQIFFKGEPIKPTNFPSKGRFGKISVPLKEEGKITFTGMFDPSDEDENYKKIYKVVKVGDILKIRSDFYNGNMKVIFKSKEKIIFEVVKDNK